MKPMTLSNDIGGSVLVVIFSLIPFWKDLARYGDVALQTVGALTTLFGFIFVIARIIRLINTDFDGNPKKFFREGFKLKKRK
ncbi:hypothetical protein [Runella sp.]|uniref:hypothetical protein n=1 Tax=Runella sp. TaxID=1960881 RepID=UPI003D0A918C